MTEWNKELEKKILRKSRFTLTFRILKVLVIFIVIYFLYMYTLIFVTNKLDVANKIYIDTTLALEWTVPNVWSDYSFTEESTNIFGTKKISYNLLKRVGNKDVVIGEANVTKKLFNWGSTIALTHPSYKDLNPFQFYLPSDQSVIQTETSLPYVWKTLEKLPEGTVGELAFSTTSMMKPEELIEKLKKYDIHILWMPLYTGENELDLIGLTGGIEYIKEDSNSETSLGGYGFVRNLYLLEEHIEESKEVMLKNMERLLNKSDNYLEYFLHLNDLDEKYKYLKEEGFIVYGAVVTGPTKELLKLKDESFIQGEQLGEIELWNWE